MDNRFYKEDSRKIINIGHSTSKGMICVDTAREILIEGNKRYVSGKLAPKEVSSKAILQLYENGQHPLAAIVTCSDSRVSPEFIFDVGLGDIFVVRNAGNIVDSIVAGSIEYAVEILKVPLVIVLGHDRCGAVKAAVDGGSISTNIESVVKNIAPAVEYIKSIFKNAKAEEIAARVEDENILRSVKKLLDSSVIKESRDNGNIDVIPAKYNMATGKVTFLGDFQQNLMEEEIKSMLSS